MEILQKVKARNVTECSNTFNIYNECVPILLNRIVNCTTQYSQLTLQSIQRFNDTIQNIIKGDDGFAGTQDVNVK